MAYKKVVYSSWDEAKGKVGGESAYARSMFENIRCANAAVTVLKEIAESGRSEKALRLERELFSEYGPERVALVLSATIRRDEKERAGDEGTPLNSPSEFSPASYEWSRSCPRLSDDSMERAIAIPGFSYYSSHYKEIFFAEIGDPDFYEAVETLREDFSAFAANARFPKRERGAGGETFVAFAVPLAAYRGESEEAGEKILRFAMPNVGEYRDRDCVFSAKAGDCEYDERSGRFSVRLKEGESQTLASLHGDETIVRRGGEIAGTVYHRWEKDFCGPFPENPLTLTEKETLERAFSAEGGGKFRRLFDGEDIARNPSRSSRMLLDRLAVRFRSESEVLRVFAASGFAGETGAEEMAKRAVSNARRLEAAQRPAEESEPQKNRDRGAGRGNGK